MSMTGQEVVDLLFQEVENMGEAELVAIGKAQLPGMISALLKLEAGSSGIFKIIKVDVEVGLVSLLQLALSWCDAYVGASTSSI